MNDTVRDAEKDKYTRMWAVDDYRTHSPAMRCIDEALLETNPPEGSTVIDLGCGTGRVSQYLADKGFDVTALDLVDNACREFDGEFIEACLWDLGELGSYEYGYCFDVMEHLPTEKVEDVIEQIAAHCGTVYFQIANFHDGFGKRIGETLHLTVEPLEWWEVRLKAYFKNVDIKTVKNHHLAVCS